ncbi:MAG: hypothetical protein ACFFCW_09650 [Candidatus Hodarchaeota archaeon]
MRKQENLPTKMIQSIKEVETLLLDDGPLEVKVIVALGRLGGAADPSAIEAEASLTPEEVYEAIVALNSAGHVIEEAPNVFQLTAMKAMEISISQWAKIVKVATLFEYCKHLIEIANETEEIANALDALRDVLFSKGVSGVVISEIAKEARTWRMGSGDREELLEKLTTWKERSPP